MAYGYKTSRKTFRKKKRVYKKGYKQSYNPTKKISYVVNQVMNKRLEKKLISTAYNTAITNSGTAHYVHMTAIAQGDTHESRTGEKISVSSINLKGFISNNASATSGTWVRFVVVRDMRQEEDTNPVYASGNDGLFTSVQKDSRLNKDTLGRFKILYMKTFIINQNFSGQVKLTPFNFYRRFVKPLPVHYNGTASTDIQRYGIYLLMISDQATNTPTPDLAINVNFTDA